ncbi:GAF domain-containing hybrid sensor histidine kinase/response regulator [Leadbettera azotonutricia]|uniref:histidine kinase n=1 Tax=Leadbettera azotonutricia (strain ATCC BAA-888 / DSM 13862 / ZAS-9) TaxID=545695 RepID=F5Y8D5_LEAAZ|nr:ATP-binding protein [Leadbettera azotonutricia]AEF82678.1 PAS/PAC sensor hybrid histidine kinase [Leadbettera azotonutricia ZAS-9]
MNQSKKLKAVVFNNLAVFLFSVAAVLVLVISIYTNVLINYISTYLSESIDERLLASARSVASLITADELNELVTVKDMEKPIYGLVKQRLIAFSKESHILYAYYFRLSPDGSSALYIVDNDVDPKTKVDLASEPWPMEDAIEWVIKHRTAVSTGLGTYAQGWESLLTAYAPIFGETGEVVAFSGVDVSDEQVIDVQNRIMILSILLVLSIVFVISSGFLSFFIYKKKEAVYAKRFEQQELMSVLSRNFISARDSTALINEALRIAGEFMGVTRILVGVPDADSDISRPVYLWCGTDAVFTDPAKTGLNDLIHSTFPKEQPDVIPTVYCNDTNADKDWQIMKIVDVKAFIWAPLYIDGKMWALLSIEECFKSRVWTESDRQLLSTLSSVVAGAITRDIREKERDAAREQAIRASQAKTDFLSNMSHEMRTPMNAIIGMTAIAKGSDDIEKKEYCLKKIEDASTHLLGVINDILDMSKIEANKFALSFANFNFEKMVQKTVNVINFKVEEKHQNLSVRIDDSIPAMLKGDDQRLAQVIANLLSNAVKFTPEGGSIRLEADLAPGSDGKSNDIADSNTVSNAVISSTYTVKVSVIDSGIGLSPEQKGRLFSSFEQADSSTSRKYGGTGLGLAISKRIVEMMGGNIWVESELGKGASFIFTAVLEKGKDEKVIQLEGQGGEAEAEKDEGAFGGSTILLAEDVDINREIVLSLLEPTRIAIDCAENGVQAVKLFTENPGKYDMIFMDVQMPEMDGYEATRKIRELEKSSAAKQVPQIPIIAMTANVFREDVEKCLEAGMNGHVGKPLDLEEVISTLRQYLK